MIQSLHTHYAGITMIWIFLSPHLDDAVLSCGGMIAELVRSGCVVEVWTICAGDPPSGPLSPLAQSLHDRWGTPVNPVETRREEDRRSCAILGAGARHFSIPDCIYRPNPATGEPLIRENDELFQPLPEAENPLAGDIQRQLTNHLPEGAQVVSPLTHGRHIDHYLVRRSAEGLNLPLLYYADFPYAIQSQIHRAQWFLPGWETIEFAVSRDSLTKWQTAIAEYNSQISTFWGSLVEMESAIETYWLSGGGNTLWGTPIGRIHNKSAN